MSNVQTTSQALTKQATFLSRVPVHCITPFCSDALVSPPNLSPSCCTQNESERARETLIWLASVTEKETGNAQPGACVDVLPRCSRDSTKWLWRACSQATTGNDYFFHVRRSAVSRVPNSFFGIRDLPYLNLGIRDLPYLNLGIRDLPYLRAGIRNFKAKWGWDVHGMLVSLAAILVSSRNAPCVGKIRSQVKP